MVYRPAEDPVAFTRRDFEPLGIEKGDPAAGITNQPLHLQRAGCQTDAAARNTQYLRHRLVCEVESATANPVTREEQPMRQALIYLVELTTNGRLRNLLAQDVSMVEQG
jgi:hypothetical protein